MESLFPRPATAPVADRCLLATFLGSLFAGSQTTSTNRLVVLLRGISTPKTPTYLSASLYPKLEDGNPRELAIARSY